MCRNSKILVCNLTLLRLILLAFLMLTTVNINSYTLLYFGGNLPSTKDVLVKEMLLLLEFFLQVMLKLTCT